MDRMKKLSETIRSLMEEEFSGYIRINFSQGSLGRVEKSEEIEDVAVVLISKNNGKKEEENVEEKELGHTMKKLPIQDSVQKKIQAIIPLFVLLTLTGGCASHRGEQIVPSGNAAGTATHRSVQSGDKAALHFLCRLQNGSVAAATDAVPEDQPKSNIFEPRKETTPFFVTAINPAEPQPKRSASLPFDAEIQEQLARTVTGMKEGENRQVTLTAQPMEPVDGGGIARVVRVRTRPKEMTIPKGDYEFRTHKTPEPGQAFTIDPAFPGRVETVTDKDVVVRFSAKPGAVIQTPFGLGRIREEGKEYKVDIDAKEGSLIRTGARIGRISLENGQVIAIDYRHPFGYETLNCEVTVENIAELKTAESGTGK